MLMALGGASLLGLAVSEVRRDRSAESWLLVLWLLGTFVFAGFVNWVNNGRSILPMAPALGILLVRRLDETPIGAAVGATAARRSGSRRARWVMSSSCSP